MAELQVIGWREWASLPELGIPALKAKVDTGAKTSCLHAFELQVREGRGPVKVRFAVHPYRNRSDRVIYCEAELSERRIVVDSGGHSEERCVILSKLRMGKHLRTVELTLTNRDTMSHRMLVGRSAVRGLFQVNPSLSYTLGHPRKWGRERIEI